MEPPTIGDIFLNPERRRVLGYPVITTEELDAFGMFITPRNPGFSVFGKAMRVYGLPVLNESQADTLETAVKTLSTFLTKGEFPERVMVGLSTMWKDEVVDE